MIGIAAQLDFTLAVNGGISGREDKHASRADCNKECSEGSLYIRGEIKRHENAWIVSVEGCGALDALDIQHRQWDIPPNKERTWSSSLGTDTSECAKALATSSREPWSEMLQSSKSVEAASIWALPRAGSGKISEAVNMGGRSRVKKQRYQFRR